MDTLTAEDKGALAAQGILEAAGIYVTVKGLIYEASPKHVGPKAWGTPNHLGDAVNQEMIAKSVSSQKNNSLARYVVGPNGEIYEFRPTRVEEGIYHSYPVPPSEVPADVRRYFFDQGLIDRNMLRGR